MTDLQPASPGERPFRQELWNAARYYLGGRTGIVIAAATVLGAGAYLNWGWLVALGLAPVIISALPCAAMCALGLCMNGRSRTPKVAGQLVDNAQQDQASKMTISKDNKDCCGK
jgi:hypothetical protein